MKRGTALILDEVEATELREILAGDDASAALAFLREHLQSKIHQMLEGG